MIRALAIAMLAGLALAAGCNHAISLDERDGGTAQNPLEEGVDPEDSDEVTYDYDGVDVLLVVDNSGSMSEEQMMLSTSVFTLISALTDPLPGSTYPPVDDLRIAVTSTDMGLQWGGEPYTDGDGWPGTPPCTASGDDGQFESYVVGKSINLLDGAIPCGEGGSQCPSGWECLGIDPETGIGACAAPGGDGTGQACPPLIGDWAASAPDADNPELAAQVACLSSLGTNGCGFEQQLVASARALERGDQADFLRPGALLAVMAVSDEDDCSVESNALFAVPEIQDLGDGRVNVACGEHQEFLYSAATIRERLTAAKGDPAAVVFGALVGVPRGEACEGAGHQIDDCLAHEKMQLDAVMEGDPAAFFFQPACTREVNDVEVTKARPGRRFVELAQQFGELGYIYSICNDDYVPVMDSFARLIMRAMWHVDPEAEDDDVAEPACQVAPGVGHGGAPGLLDLAIELIAGS